MSNFLRFINSFLKNKSLQLFLHLTVVQFAKMSSFASAPTFHHNFRHKQKLICSFGTTYHTTVKQSVALNKTILLSYYCHKHAKYPGGKDQWQYSPHQQLSTLFFTMYKCGQTNKRRVLSIVATTSHQEQQQLPGQWLNSVYLCLAEARRIKLNSLHTN